MTNTMSTEGDSSKSVISEPNEKSGTDNNTDSSQDSHDVNDVSLEKAATENNVEAKEDEGEIKEEKQDVKPQEKKEELDVKSESDKKLQSDEELETEEADKASEKSEKEKKKEKEEEKSENSEKEEESDKAEEDKEVPLLDQPLQKSGKRERKNVQRFNEEFPSEHKEAKVEFIEGKGTALGDIPRIDASISRFKNDDLKPLHRLLFKVIGKNALVKKNIRKFSGFDFSKDSEEYEKKVSIAQKFDTKQLKSICEMLDLQKTGTKDELVHRIMDFLLEPKDSGKPIDGGRPKRTAAVRANNRGYSSHDDYSSDEKQSSRARRDKGKRSNLKDDSSSDEDFQPNQSDASDEKPTANKRKRKSKRKKSSDDEEASDASIVSSEESDDEPKSKRKPKTPVKANNKSKSKRTPGRRGRPPASMSSKKKKEEVDDKEVEGSSSSEDEPLAKKAKASQPPTDEEIKAFIKSILEGANLEKITMKNVCQRVYGHYPDFDLAYKKEFIKSTVKSLIST